MTQNASAFVQDCSDKKRTDDVFTLTLRQALRPVQRWSFNLGETFQYYVSNQNAFDANQAFFTDHYYNFTDVQLNPSVTLYWEDAIWDLTWGGSYGYRRYSHRRTQNTVGTYEDALAYSMDRGTSLS